MSRFNLYNTYDLAPVKQICYTLGTGDVRLVNVPNSTMCEGRLDLYFNEPFIQGWFAVCDNNFDEGEMQVVCQQLGCPYNNGYRTNILKYVIIQYSKMNHAFNKCILYLTYELGCEAFKCVLIIH